MGEPGMILGALLVVPEVEEGPPAPATLCEQ